MKTKWNGSIDPKKILASKWGLILIFEVWSQKKKWKKNGQTRWQMKVEYVRNKKWKNKQEMVEKIEENGFGNGIEKNNKIKIKI